MEVFKKLLEIQVTVLIARKFVRFNIVNHGIGPSALTFHVMNIGSDFEQSNYNMNGECVVSYDISLSYFSEFIRLWLSNFSSN